ncbi:hypothetical protein ACNKHM_14300 [Shigella sonnei]
MAAHVRARDLSENVSGTRYSWKVSGMDGAGCAQAGKCRARACRRESGTGVVRHQKLAVDADNDIRVQVEPAVQGGGYSRAMNRPRRTKNHAEQTLPLITLIVMMAISWGWNSSIIRLVNWRLSRPRWLGCTQLLVRHYGDQIGSDFAIETLMSVAAIVRCSLAQRLKLRWCCRRFDRRERWKAGPPVVRVKGSARNGAEPDTVTCLRNGERRGGNKQPAACDVIEVAAGGRLPADGNLLYRSRVLTKVP